MKIILTLLWCCLIANTALCKKQKKVVANSVVKSRIESLSDADLELFNALPAKQQKQIKEQKIAEGFNSWMVTLSLGEPYYKSEHHPVFVDFEEVWLYTKSGVVKDVKEEKIIDIQTNWPTLHRYTKTTTCLIGDFFVLFDRSVAQKVTPDESQKRYGSCEITTKEEFLPIIN